MSSFFPGYHSDTKIQLVTIKPFSQIFLCSLVVNCCCKIVGSIVLTDRVDGLVFFFFGLVKIKFLVTRADACHQVH